jgi:hypothetical protein
MSVRPLRCRKSNRRPGFRCSTELCQGARSDGFEARFDLRASDVAPASDEVPPRPPHRVDVPAAAREDPTIKRLISADIRGLRQRHDIRVRAHRDCGLIDPERLVTASERRIEQASASGS